MNRQSSPIPDRVSHEKDHEREIGVASLQRDPTIECLKVGEPHFRLDCNGDASEPALRVPRSRIAAAGERDLGSPVRPRRQLSMQPLEEPSVTCIADRVAVEVRPRSEL